MPEYIYFLTIDKVKLDNKPTKKELLKVRNEICRNAELDIIRPYQVHCFEYKNKGAKHGQYLHYHTLLTSKKSFIPYKLIKKDGYSLKLEKMKTYSDVARTAGYINKLKQDRCDLDTIAEYLKIDL